MQSGGVGQYGGGVPGIQQFMVEGCSPHTLFASVSHDHNNIPPPSQTKHHLISPRHHPIHGFQNQQQQQQQQRAVLQQQQQLQALGSGSDSPETRSRDLDPNTSSSRAVVSAFKPASHVEALRDQQGAQPPQSTTALTDEDIGGGEDGERSGGGNRWPREETLALLRIRSGMDSNFRDSTFKGPLWENVSRKLAELGYNRSAKKCKEKFENVNKYYKKTKDGRIGRQDGKSYRFFSELEALYGRNARSNNGGAGRSSAANASVGTNGALSIGQGSDSVLTGIGAGVQGAVETGDAVLNLTSDNTSEDDYQENSLPAPKAQEQINRKKRKRKQLASISLFLESLMKQLMDHQEELQRKFLDAIERKDEERLNREEAWKRQEMARLTRQTELRAQEYALASSREAAIVALLEKLTGQDLKLPKSTTSDPIGTEVAPSEMQQDQQDKELMSDPNSRRWPKPEVNALIRLRSGMESRFQEPGLKGPLWEEISSRMASLGFHRSAKRCKEKWENINKYFRKTKHSLKRRPENAKTCPYFQQLDILYGKGVLPSPTTKSHKLEGQSSDTALLDHGGDCYNNDNNNNDDPREDTQVQSRPDSELLSMIAGEPGGSAATKTKSNAMVQHIFQNPDDHDYHNHPVDQTQKRFKVNQNPSEISPNNQTSNSLSGLNFETGSKAAIGNKRIPQLMETIVKEMLGMQQQKFLDEFNRREHEHEHEQSMSDEETQPQPQNQNHDQQQEQEQELSQTSQDERSQTALMALVHKLTVSTADYATE